MFQINMKYDEYTAPIHNGGKASKLFKRGIKGGLKVNIAEIPEQVLAELLLSAITEHLRVGLKGLDKDTCTQEECVAAMQGRLDILMSGALSSTDSPRKAPTQDPVKREARAILKKAIQDRTEDKLDGRVLTKAVSDLFKAHAAYGKAVKAGDEETQEKFASIAKLVEDALSAAKAKVDAQKAMSKTLAPLVEAAKKATAAKKAAAEAAGEVGEAAKPVAKPKAATAAKAKPKTAPAR